LNKIAVAIAFITQPSKDGTKNDSSPLCLFVLLLNHDK